MDKKIVVLGAGISGLTTAYLLHKDGYDVTILEKRSEPGGSMESVFEKGFLFDRGPNSALETTPLIAEIVEDLGLTDELIYANKEGNKRYILRNNQLHALPMSPPAFIKSRLFSAKAKLRIFGEPFVGKSDDGYYQSIAEFVKRRLGQEFLDYAINPFVAGVYAGKPEELSVKSAFPKLYALEEKYGGLIVGTIRSIRERKKRAEKSKQSAKMLSFKSGMQTLPNKLAETLGEKLILQADVTHVAKTGNGYKVHYSNAGEEKVIDFSVVLSTVPAFIASEIFGHLDEELVNHFNDIYYPPVLVVFLVYDKDKVKQPLDGFGFLIPEKEKKSFLGAIWSSVIFQDRVEHNKAAFTLFVGGARNAAILNTDKELLINRVRKEFEELMNITGNPIHTSYRYWNKAIPQYKLGYIEHERYFDSFEEKYPGIILSGNYRGGISVGDCIKNSGIVAGKIKKVISAG